MRFFQVPWVSESTFEEGIVGSTRELTMFAFGCQLNPVMFSTGSWTVLQEITLQEVVAPWQMARNRSQGLSLTNGWKHPATGSL